MLQVSPVSGSSYSGSSCPPLERLLNMSSGLRSPPRHPDCGQNHLLGQPEERDASTMIDQPQSTSDVSERSHPLAPIHLNAPLSPPPSSPDKERKLVPRTTSRDLDDSFSQRHLSEDISRYPSTISGHIGQATRDDRFAHATGPYHLVPVDEFGVKVDVPQRSKMLSNESRDPTFSSFEAFVLAPSTSSFTIYDKANSNTNEERHEEMTAHVEGKERKTPAGPSPLQNQVKLSMESRRTVTSNKQSSDTIRSGQSAVDTFHPGTKSSKQSWSLFSRITPSSPQTDSTAYPEIRHSSNAKDHSSPTKPSSNSAVTPKTQRQLRKLSVQPVSPFHIPLLSHDVSGRKDPSRRSRVAVDSRDRPQADVGEASMSSPASEKTIKSFSALYRASMDTPTVTEKSRAWAIPSATPTKRKNQPSRDVSRNDSGVIPSAATFPQLPSAAVLGVPSSQVNSRVTLVANNQPMALPTSTSGVPRVESTYLDDEDLCIRLESREGCQRVTKEIGTADADVKSGYWDYSIVTGIGGSPSRDYSLLLRNASMMRDFSDIAGPAQNQVKDDIHASTKADKEPPIAPPSLATINGSGSGSLTAPRSSSDKSLTCSSNYPDDTDDISENSHSKYSEKRRGRHARRRRPVSMASLAAPLGEDPLDVVHQIAGVETKAEAASDDATEVADECQPPLQVDTAEPALGSITPGESSFAQVRCVVDLCYAAHLIARQSLPEVTTDTEAGTLFTRFPSQQTSLSTATQFEQFTALGSSFRFPPPPSQKHSSLLSDILAVTRDSYQARKDSKEAAESSSVEDKSKMPPSRAIVGNTSHNGRVQRGSIVGARTGDPSLQVIHEDETATTNLPLTSESLRELDRRLAAESLQGGGTRDTSARDLTLRDTETPAGLSSAVVTGVAIAWQNTGQRQSPESQDNLSLATTTTVRPSFHAPQTRQTQSGRSHRLVAQQPPRSAMQLRPLGQGTNMRRPDDELAEGIYDTRGESRVLCVCFGRRLW